ncbi:FHA domain-containing protein [Nostoc sp. FACHB-152]|uniref:FHA domain-containing protein n=1 Tax=unclassified Nostoc TaxID=2593658 RepID=UPI001683767A|nr:MULTISPECIES: FHA domain-containing protein [unclassified Nostoc]MBD2448391.1 FHA domain-containing protein [Nostoc sp. FACHB-152]MBD2470831.1 FHA domain-containing protein [Nostoc sp. FACHB-145]
MQIQLTWTDPNTSTRTELRLETPVAIGRQTATMPQQIGEKGVSRVAIADDLIADYHALIDEQNQELIIIDQNTNNGIKINGVQSSNGILKNGDRIQIGTAEIVVNITTTAWECDRMVGFLFKRRCGRTDRTNCPFCNESYTEDYAYYPNYGSYRDSWGSSYYRETTYSYESETGNVDFTDADGNSLEDERNTDFETNMGAS